jgi:hypothetical protein
VGGKIQGRPTKAASVGKDVPYYLTEGINFHTATSKAQTPNLRSTAGIGSFIATVSFTHIKAQQPRFIVFANAVAFFDIVLFNKCHNGTHL